MSLYERRLLECTGFGVVSEPDGEGGQVERYREICSFRAAFAEKSSCEKEVAQQKERWVRYDVLMPPSTEGFCLKEGDHFRCVETGEEFHVVSRPAFAPTGAGLRYCHFEAEGRTIRAVGKEEA